MFPTEDTKEQSEPMNNLRRYSQTAVSHMNPLLFNKGNVPKTPSANHTICRGFSSEEDIEIPEESATNFITTKVRSFKSKTNIKYSSILIADEDLNDSSELRTVERNQRMLNLLRIPIFETHDSEHLTPEKNKEAPAVKTRESALVVTAPYVEEHKLLTYKSKTLKTAPTPSIESMGAKLTIEQHDYLKAMYEFKDYYLYYVLKKKEIFRQYVAMSKANMSFTKSKIFQEQKGNLLLETTKFNRNTDKIGPQMKTLVLDLDETLVYSSTNDMEVYDTQISSDDKSNPVKVIVF